MKLNIKLIEKGVKISSSLMSVQDKIWSRYSNDKVDIGEELGKAIRTLMKALPINKKMSALSIGSSAEPQFRLLENAFREALYLLDVEKEALDVIRERIERQMTTHAFPIQADYRDIFLHEGTAREFFDNSIAGKKVELITLHHSLYYSTEKEWHMLFNNFIKYLMADISSIHAVLMASKSDDPYTTTWLYNHFAGKYCGCTNDQDLIGFGTYLKRMSAFKNTQIHMSSHNVYFNVNDFEKFMAGIWMILLYPNVHKYTMKQREEITEFVYKRFWVNKKPLIQKQDHLIVYKGVKFKGLI